MLTGAKACRSSTRTGCWSSTRPSRTRAARPGAGIDLEPNKDAQQITHVRIENSKFFDNAGGGIMVAGKKARVSKVEMTRNTFRGNRPFVVENAPAVAAAICGNRQTSVQAETSGGFTDRDRGTPERLRRERLRHRPRQHQQKEKEARQLTNRRAKPLTSERRWRTASRPIHRAAG